ncbi:MAG TPA: hypothetical protein VKC89_03765 [Patescibacteria group bacterium]|nr:hypothetical protein [Patescibacteria group bacterium]
METGEAQNLLLKRKYDLHNSPEVKSAAKRTKAKSGEKVSQDPLLLIQNYLDRFKEITDRKDPAEREHGLDAIKRLLHGKFVIKPNEIPEGYFENQRRLARELGHGNIEITIEARDQLTEVIIADQRSSLDKWIDYLSSSDAPYSSGLKYFTLRSILSMGEYDKEKKQFNQRSKGTVKPFPDLNREALAYVLDAIDKKYKGQNINLTTFEEKDKEQFEKLLKSENFAKLYAFAIEKVTPASPVELSGIAGVWKKYDQNSDPMPLVESLQGHGTGWCTAGESTAETQLKGGDFYVYYSLDRNGLPTIPRSAIRMEGNQIAEVRGIASEQNLDPAIISIVDKKLQEFPDGSSYKKKVHDMGVLTEIEGKVRANQSLSKEDLLFLYEIDSRIEGFGYEKDPRIEELREQRNPEEDIPIIFNCSIDQIARKVSKINKNTKVYIGELWPRIFDVFRKYSIEHVYTSFPEGKIRFQSLEIGGKSSADLQKELKEKGIKTTEYTESLLESLDFKTLKSPQNIDLVRLTGYDLGFDEDVTIDQIYKRAKKLGLELCPAEVGPHLRLKDLNQPLVEWYSIAMQPITASHDVPRAFLLMREGGGGLWLYDYVVVSYRERENPGEEFVFSLPPAPERSNGGQASKL